ncbi:MAG: Ig-like domain-containing protein [Firmicutes bacterium]|nr:Ig-like domain-containing protein [Bacillota bacterium]
MKRISALLCAMILTIFMMAPACFAAQADAEATDASQVTKPGFELVSSSPEDGATGVAVDNFSVKIYFSKEMLPKSEAVRKANEKQFTLVDEEGESIPVKVYYSEKEKKRGLMMVAADYSNNNEKNVQIKGATTYTLTIGDGLQAADGSTYNNTTKLSLKTLNQQRSMIVYMILMFAMMGGMVYFTMRSTKKAAEKEKEEHATKGVNPYKEAKKTGKSVDEIVAKNEKQRSKKQQAEEKRRAAEAELEARILEEMRREKNKRVAGPRPISAVGGTYKVEVKRTRPNAEPKKTNKGTTNPKNQSGKKKNVGKKKKK